MPEEFLPLFNKMIGKVQQDVLTLPDWPLQRKAYHFTTLVWKMPPSVKLALDRPIWKLLAACRATH